MAEHRGMVGPGGFLCNMCVHWPTNALIHNPKLIEQQGGGEKREWKQHVWTCTHFPEPLFLVSGTAHYSHHFLTYIFIK